MIYKPLQYQQIHGVQYILVELYSSWYCKYL